MKFSRAIKEKFLPLYTLTFVMGLALYTAVLFNPESKQTIIIYFGIVFLFLFGYIVFKQYFAKDKKIEDETNPIVSLQEVKELIRYSAAHGIDKIPDPDKSELASQLDGKTILAELTDLTTEWERSGKLEDHEFSKLVLLYSKLNLFTPEHVTGKTLCDSLKVDDATEEIRQITWWVIFPLILLNVFLEGWFKDQPEPEQWQGFLYYLLCFQRYILDYINPFLWGAMGSCVYLLKVFSDLAENYKFNEDKLQGWGTRITLGAILGGVIQFIYDKTAFGNSGMNLDANAIGFLTGVGVKVVYGGLEKTIEKLSTFMNLESIKTVKTDTAPIRRYLNEQIVKLGDSDQDKTKRLIIQELISNLNDSE